MATPPAGAKIKDETDPKTGIPIFSLYMAEDRGPTAEMLKDVDVLVYDLQEVGGRTWTYVSTMALSMQAAAKKKIPSSSWTARIQLVARSSKGHCSIPGSIFRGHVPDSGRHGMTVGELAKLFNQKYGIGVDLIVAARPTGALAMARGHRAAVGESLSQPSLAGGADELPGICLLRGHEPYRRQGHGPALRADRGILAQGTGSRQGHE